MSVFSTATWAQHVKYVTTKAVNRLYRPVMLKANEQLDEHTPLWEELVEAAVFNAQGIGLTKPSEDNAFVSKMVEVLTPGDDEVASKSTPDVMAAALGRSRAVTQAIAQNVQLLAYIKQQLQGLADGEPGEGDGGEGRAPGTGSGPIEAPEGWEDQLKQEADQAQDGGKSQGNSDAALWQMLNIWTDVEELSKQNNPGLRDILQAAGRMMAMASATGTKRMEGRGVEIVGMTLGNDPTKLPAGTLAKLKHPLLRRQVLADLAMQRAPNFETITEIEAATGPIVVLLDASGSMHGEPNTLARGAALAVLADARQSKRDVTVMTFGSNNQYRRQDWLFRSNPMGTTFGDDVVKFACSFESYGGTDFDAHLDRAADIIRDAPAFNTADILMITDGCARFPNGWLAKFAKRKANLGFRSYLVGIGASNAELAKLMDLSMDLNPHASQGANESQMAGFVKALKDLGLGVPTAA